MMKKHWTLTGGNVLQQKQNKQTATVKHLKALKKPNIHLLPWKCKGNNKIVFVLTQKLKFIRLIEHLSTVHQQELSKHCLSSDSSLHLFTYLDMC